MMKRAQISILCSSNSNECKDPLFVPHLILRLNDVNSLTHKILLRTYGQTTLIVIPAYVVQSNPYNEYNDSLTKRLLFFESCQTHCVFTLIIHSKSLVILDTHPQRQIENRTLVQFHYQSCIICHTKTDCVFAQCTLHTRTKCMRQMHVIRRPAETDTQTFSYSSQTSIKSETDPPHIRVRKLQTRITSKLDILRLPQSRSAKTTMPHDVSITNS
eukprot:971614_1